MTPQITAEIITIGDELLYGQILDTNSQWISAELDKLGIRTRWRTTIGDHEEDILSSFKTAEERSDLVLITGGLGPTHDDLTKPCMAKYYNTPVVMNQEALAQITSFFEKRGIEMTESNRKQAELPEASVMISNPMGTAPGMWFEREGTIMVSMPGVPHEMKYMMTHVILPQVREFFETPVIVHKLIKTAGIGESWLSDKIQPWETTLPEHIKLAYLPSPGIVKLRLTATGSDPELLMEQIDAEIERLKPLAGKYIFGYNKESLESALGKLLLGEGKTIALAESCTGGFLAHKMTSIPGSSAYFKGGVVAYSNEIKIDILGVNEDTIDTHGAVREETVLEMASRVRELFKSDVGVSISGIAGPDGGTPEKPVGTVWIAYSDEDITFAKKLQLVKDRLMNIQYSAVGASTLAWKTLKQKHGEYSPKS